MPDAGQFVCVAGTGAVVTVGEGVPDAGDELVAGVWLVAGVVGVGVTVPAVPQAARSSRKQQQMIGIRGRDNRLIDFALSSFVMVIITILWITKTRELECSLLSQE
jgi:hypothetical protein